MTIDTSEHDLDTVFTRLAGAPIARVAIEGRPVSANRIWRIAGRDTKSGKRQMYLTDAAAAWEMAVIADTVSQVDTRVIARASKLRIRCVFYGVRGDADNYLKATLDGLKRALKIDDREFAEVSSSVHEGKHKPGARIEIYGDLPPEPEPDPDATQQLPALAPVTATWVAPAVAVAAERVEEIAAATKPAHAPHSLRARDLVDETVLPRFYQPVSAVTIHPTPAYGGLFFLIPASAALGTQEWGAFLGWAHARELRDRLTEVLLPNTPVMTPATPPALPDAREAVRP